MQHALDTVIAADGWNGGAAREGVLPTTLAFGYRPLIDPLSYVVPSLHGGWLVLLLPMALFVAMAYKAVRVHPFVMADYARAVVVMTVQIVAAIVGLGALTFVLVQWVVPMVAPVVG